MKQFLLVILFSVVVRVLLAQEGSPIFTDRPNATDAPALIDIGDFQTEVGFFSATDKVNGVTNRAMTQPNISIKYGLLKWLEIRVLTNFMTEISDVGSNSAKTSGITPITLSPKFEIIDQDGFVRNLSVTTSLTFPNVGEKAFQNNKLNLGYRFLMNNRITDKIDWSHNLGTDWDDNTNASWIYTSSFGFVITDKLGAFTELYGTFDDTSSNYNWDAGLTYLLLNNLVADVMVGGGLNQIAPDYIVSFGFAWKTNFKK